MRLEFKSGIKVVVATGMRCWLCCEQFKTGDEVTIGDDLRQWTHVSCYADKSLYFSKLEAYKDFTINSFTKI